MAKRLKHVDVVTIGVGLTGSLMALELARTGLKVVGIERGAPRFTVPDFQSPAIHDELRFSIRKAMMQDNVKEAITFRNRIRSDRTADPALGELPAGNRPRRLIRPLERPELPISGRRLHLQNSYRAALRQENSRCRPDDPGLGRDVRRTRAPF